MLSQFDTPNESIVFKWAFPNYASFDPTYTATFTVADGTPGGKQRMYGDLKSTATFAEKTVGFTWSDPAVGALTLIASVDRRHRRVRAISPTSRRSIPNAARPRRRPGTPCICSMPIPGCRSATARARSCPTISSGSGIGHPAASIIGDVGNGRKNALQADPTAAGDSGSRGRRRRISATSMASTGGSISRPPGRSPRTRWSTPVSRSTHRRRCCSSAAPTSTCSSRPAAICSPATAPGGTGTFKLYGLKDNYAGAGATTKFAVDLATVTQFGRPGDRRAAVDVAVGRRRHRVLHDDDGDGGNAVRRFQREPVCADLRGWRGLRLEQQRQDRQQREPDREDICRPRDRRRSSSISISTPARAGPTALASRRSAIPRTSTTASGRLACASCRGGKFDSGESDHL